MVIASEIPLPQLPPAAGDSTPDLIIRRGAVEPGIVSRPGYRRGQLHDQFRYAVTGGRDMVVDLLPAASPKNVSDGIMSRLMTAALYQRGLLPLHASAVACPRGLIAVSGPSGVGKSTLAAALVARDGRIVADDTLVLPLDGDPSAALPGACGLKLAREALSHHGYSTDGLALANEVEGKYFLPLPPCSTEGLLHVSLLVQIMEGAQAVKPVSPVEAAARWGGCIRMPDLMHLAPDPAMLRRRWLDFAASVPVFAVSHGGRLASLDAVVDRIEAVMSAT